MRATEKLYEKAITSENPTSAPEANTHQKPFPTVLNTAPPNTIYSCEMPNPQPLLSAAFVLLLA